MPWGNFHDSSPRAKDYKLRFAAEDTHLWGAYMTDALVNFPQTNSGVVRAHMQAHPEEVAAQLDRLEEEIQSLGVSDPLLVGLGGAAFDLIHRRFGDSYRIVKVTHYSHTVGQSALREEMLTTIEQALRTHKAKQFYESRCQTKGCAFSGGKVDVTIDYQTPYETGYSWVCPVCGTKNATEFSIGSEGWLS